MGIPFLPIAGALLGGLTGYMTAPEDNKLGGTITGGVLGGLTGGIGKLAGLGGKAAATATNTGRIANSSWNPVSLLKSAYTPDAGGLFNLGMDALPLITDIANNDVGAKSFTGFAGTMAGTRFGGRELNSVGSNKLKNSEYTYMKQADMKNLKGAERNDFITANTNKRRTALMGNLNTSKQGYNMAVGMGADMGLYSLTAGMNKPKESPDMIRAREQQEFSNSPVSKYMQLTGML